MTAHIIPAHVRLGIKKLSRKIRHYNLGVRSFATRHFKHIIKLAPFVTATAGFESKLRIVFDYTLSVCDRLLENRNQGSPISSIKLTAIESKFKRSTHMTIHSLRE